MSGKAGLLVFADDWGRHPSSCQHLVRHVSDRYEVCWVNTIGMRPPRFDANTVRRGVEKLQHWLKETKDPESVPDTAVQIVNPLMWPWFSRRFDRELNRRLLLRRLNRCVQQLSPPVTAVTAIPIVADLVGRLPVKRWIYYCVDDFSQWPGLDQRMLAGMERELLEKVDGAISVSHALRSRLADLNRHSLLLTHGVDYEYWTAGNSSCPPQVISRERPHIVFWGVIDQRMDVDWLRRLAAEMSEGTIILVGPHDNADPAITQLPRVAAVGPVDYRLLPSVAAESAVLVMPYRDISVTNAMQPLKLKEYMATGCPVVARRLPATEPWLDCLDVCDSALEFSKLVRQRAIQGLPVEQRIARERLREESWQKKAQQFSKYLENPDSCAVMTV